MKKIKRVFPFSYHLQALMRHGRFPARLPLFFASRRQEGLNYIILLPLQFSNIILLALKKSFQIIYFLYAND
jgi:hypothetical protein